MSRLEQLRRERAIQRVQLELANRNILISVHAALGISVGATMVMTGAPAPAEDWLGSWVRLALGLWALISGLVLVVGVLYGENRPCGYRSMLGGMTALAAWHAAMAICYVAAVFESGIVFVEPGQAIDPAITSRGYIPLIYICLLLLSCVHVNTLVRLGPPPR